MKVGKILIVLCLMCLGWPAWGQNSSVDLTGRVVEEGSNQPIEQATVRLLNPKDSSLVRGVASIANGSFTLKNVKKGSYLLNISFVGFDPLYKTVRVSGTSNPQQLGTLALADGSVQLGEALVIGKAAEISVRNDTVEYNAESYKVSEGAVLEDLLKKMPGVEVDSDGKVTVNGKEIKKVLIDGKEFFSDDPKVASKNLPSKMIDKIQVLDKKSDMALMTGFDDGEEETVINLTVKPGMKQGWFGNAYAGYGSEDRYEGNAMVNRFINNDQITFMGGVNNTNNMGFSDLASTMFSGMQGGRRMSRGAGSGITTSGNAGLNFSKEFSDKFTWGGNVRFSHSDNDARSTSNAENILPGDSSYLSLDKVVDNTINNNVGVNFRMEWKPDTLTQILFRPDFSYSNSNNSEIGSTLTMDNHRDTINTQQSNNNSEGNGYNLSARLEYSRKLNSAGRVFSASISGGVGDSYNQGFNYSDIQYYRQSDAGQGDLIDQKYRFDNNSFNYRAYASWVEPIGRNNFIQLTYSFSQSNQKSLKNSLNKGLDGEYSVLDTANSKSYRNYFYQQRASLSFKAQRAKYNYTLGINLDPSYSKSESFVGDTILSTIKRHVFNISPMAQFNYLFDKRTNLRIMYNGRTSQPSMTQLQPVADVSDPLNIKVGNPDLDPTYTNSLFARFQRFVPEKQSALMVMLNASYVLNDIVSYSTYNENGGKITTYKNVDGNYSANLRVLFNTPLKNKKFSINTMTMGSFANSNGYINAEKNTNRNLIAQERAGIDFRSTYLDLGVNGNIRYNRTTNTLQAQNNQNTYNYGVGGSTTIYFPWEIKLESDINWSTNSGYSDGYEQNEILWNASLSKSFLRGNQATLRFKIYDILQQRSNISRSVTASSTTDTEYNTLNSYFMVHFIYRFSIFKGGASMKDVRGPMGGSGRGPMGPPPGRF
ncbi:MAG: outer membrane beta-barrel protein [Parabacteroides sp.]